MYAKKDCLSCGEAFLPTAGQQRCCSSACSKMRRLMATRRYRERNPGAGRTGEISRKYGLSPKGFQNLLEEQGGGCKICGGPPTGHRSPHLHVDHDHRTGKIRGLLCSACNQGLGLFKESPFALESALVYLASA